MCRKGTRMSEIETLVRRYTMPGIYRGKSTVIHSIDRRRGAGFLAAMLFLLFITSVAYGQDLVCSDCHGTPHGPDCNPSCSGCHGNPPTLSSIGGPDGLVGSPALPTGALSASAHTIHATPSGSNYPCDTCHYGGMPATPLLGNDKIQIGFNIYGAGGGSYDGHALNFPYTYEGTHGTTITAGGSLRCSGIYCHSDGTAVSTGVIQGNPSVPWDAPGPLPCNSCHGFPPLYAQDQPKSNSHSWHTGFGCNVCHYATTMDGTTITNFTRHANANSVYEVVPDTNFRFNGNPVTFSYQYDPGGGRCSSLSCHGSKYWGGVQYNTIIRSSYGSGCYEVIFSADASGGAAPYSYVWDFGDGQTGQGQSLIHYYASANPYTVTLNARDAKNHPANPIQVQVAPRVNANVSPVANVSMSITDYTVTLTDLSYDPDYNSCGRSGPGKVIVYWGDGSAPTSQNVNFTNDVNGSRQVFTHTYSAASTNVIYYDVYDNAGAVVRYSPNLVASVPAKYTLTVNTSPPLSSVYMYLKQNGIVKQTKITNSLGSVTFTNVVAGTYQVQATRAGYTFDGDQSTAGNQNPATVTLGPDKTLTFMRTP